MPAAWPVLVFGWPAVMLALTAFLGAVVFRSRAIGVMACLGSVPPCLFISAYPAARVMGLVVLACNIGGAVALFRDKRPAAAMLWLPFGVLAFALGVLFFRGHGLQMFSR